MNKFHLILIVEYVRNTHCMEINKMSLYSYDRNVLLKYFWTTYLTGFTTLNHPLVLYFKVLKRED